MLWQNYTIQPGETLYRIALNHGLSVDALKAANGLKNDQIRSGEVLRVPASANQSPVSNGVVAVVQISRSSATTGLSSTPAGSVAALLSPSFVGGRAYEVAQRYLGVPYVWGGMSPEGLDCSGLTSLVFAELGVSLPRTSALQWTFGLPVEPAQLRSGDLVFFETTGQGVSHVGIYVGGGHFIHAASTPPRVIESDLAETYWSTHYLGARRVVEFDSI